MGCGTITIGGPETPREVRSLGTPQALCRWLANLDSEAEGLCPAIDHGAVDVVPSAVEHALKLGYVRGELDGRPVSRWNAEALYTLTALGEAYARWGAARVLEPDA